jgi:hypothetical protein
MVQCDLQDLAALFEVSGAFYCELAISERGASTDQHTTVLGEALVRS